MKNYVISIDIGGTNLRIALIDLKAKIIDMAVVSTQDYTNTKDDLIEIIVKSIKRIITMNRIKKAAVFGVGIGVPGGVDFKKGIIYYMVNIKGWNNIPLKAILEKKTKLSVYIDNDVNLMALGEAVYGAGKNAKNIFCITLGTGVGGGIIIDGNIYRGASGWAGEIGHMPLENNGMKCNCGNKGCLEAYVGNSFLMKAANKVFSAKKLPRSPKELAVLAKSGDKRALKIWSNAAFYLSKGLSQTAALLNPEKIIIGGGMAKVGSFFFKLLRDNVKKYTFAQSAKNLKIVPAKLGNNAGLIGAMVLVRQLAGCRMQAKKIKQN